LLGVGGVVRDAAFAQITVVELLPRSSDEKIVVDLIAPPPTAFAAQGSVSASGGGALSGEGQLKAGGVMRNKITNNVVFALNLKPQQKIELPFQCVVSRPHSPQFAGNLNAESNFGSSGCLMDTGIRFSGPTTKMLRSREP